MYCLLLTVGLVSIAFGETIEINNGLGVDGATYGSWARDFPQEVIEEGVTGYQAQRILPSAVVHYTLRVLGIDHTTDNIVLAFKYYNLGLLLVALFFWLKTARLFKLSTRASWLGFMLIFGSFAVLRVTFYYPVLTDTTAMALGMATVWAYFARRTAVLVLLTTLGAFTWPIVVYFGVWLVLFPFRGSTVAERETAGRPAAGRRTIAFAAVATGCAGFVLAAWYMHYHRRLEIITYNHVDSTLVPLSLVIVVLYLTAVLSAAARWLPEGVRSVRATDGLARRAAVVVGVLVLLRAMTALVASSDPSGSAYGKRFLEAIVLTPIQRPGVFFVAHVTYFGVLPILVLIFWRPFVRTLTSLGVGVAVLGFVNLVLALVSETRGLLFVMPLFVTVLVLATRDYAWTRLQYATLAVSALALSKVWLPLNTGQPCDSSLPEDLIAEVCTPRYFMHLGPWMERGPYVAHLLATVAVAALLFLILRDGRRHMPAGAPAATAVAGADNLRPTQLVADVVGGGGVSHQSDDAQRTIAAPRRHRSDGGHAST